MSNIINTMNLTTGSKQLDELMYHCDKITKSCNEIIRILETNKNITDEQIQKIFETT